MSKRWTSNFPIKINGGQAAGLVVQAIKAFSASLDQHYEVLS
jgi:hypothetical protein